MPTNTSIIKIQTMYVAYYGRPGDPEGVNYWANRLDDSGGNLNAVIDAFGDSDEYIDNYGHLEIAVLVTTLYQQILGRDADREGLRFYSNLLDSGAKTLASIALDIANGVQGDDITTLNNKLDVAQHFTGLVAASDVFYGDWQSIFAKTTMEGVSSDANTVDVAKAESDAYVQAIMEDLPDGVIIRENLALGSIFPSDYDTFYVELKAGIEYLFNLSGADTGGALIDLRLSVLADDDGDNIYWLVDESSSGTLLFTSAATGTHIVYVNSLDSSVGTYTLTMDWLGNDAIDGGISTNRELSSGGEVSNYIDYAGDEDWFSIDLTAGIEYRFDLQGRNSDSSGAMLNPVLSLYDASGTLLLKNDSGGNGLDSLLYYTPDSTDGYFLGVENRNASAIPGADGRDGIEVNYTISEIGTYVLSAQESLEMDIFT